jgi:transcriptional regulator with XRE-family HTH domain
MVGIMPTSGRKPPKRNEVFVSSASAEPEVFRHYLREWRQHRGLSQDDLAKALKTSKGEISRYERGERTISLLIQFNLMRALQITPGQFFSPPGARSADALLSGLSPEDRDRILAAVEALVGAKAP